MHVTLRPLCFILSIILLLAYLPPSVKAETVPGEKANHAGEKKNIPHCWRKASCAFFLRE